MPEVRIEDVRTFMVECLEAVGTPPAEAREQASLLLHADISGHFSHGINRLEYYMNDILQGGTKPKATPFILKETAATAWIDGCNALGATVGNFSMQVAIRKAKEVGIGWVSTKGSNHFGMAGYWALMAEREGLIGMAFTNTSPIMVPTRAKNSALGTNPISMAAPASEGDALVVDLATTAVAMGKIEVQIHKKEPIVEGWALGPDGKPTTDAKLAFAAGKLQPLGGFENTSGYKGYALSSMVEIFCSALSGSKATHEVRPWSFDSNGDPSDLGQCFVAIDPNCFAPGFGERVADLLRHYRSLEPADPELPVLAPGDKERAHAKATKERGTIIYSKGQFDSCANVALRMKIEVMPLATD